MALPKIYNNQFLAHPGQLPDPKYGVSVTRRSPIGTQPTWRCIGIAHLTGAQNGGNHHVFLDVLDEKGQRINGARLLVSNAGKAPFPVTIDKLANEAGADVPMHWNDTFKIWVAGDHPSDEAHNFHIRHEDEGAGTTRGHHSFYVVFQRAAADSVIEPEEPPVEEPPPVSGLTYTIATRTIYTVEADGEQVAAAADLESARRIVAALVLLEASEKDRRAAAYTEGLRRLAED